jgi:hypothetical protein
MQWPECGAIAHRLFSSLGVGAGLVQIQLDHRVQHRVQPLDPGDTAVQHLDRRNLPGPNHPPQLHSVELA